MVKSLSERISSSAEEKSVAILLIILAVVLLPFTILYIFFSYGIAISYLWSWFVVPLGVKPISVPLAVGLVVLASMFNSVDIYKHETDTAKLIGFFIRPWIILFFGYLISLFV